MRNAKGKSKSNTDKQEELKKENDGLIKAFPAEHEMNRNRNMGINVTTKKNLNCNIENKANGFEG